MIQNKTQRNLPPYYGLEGWLILVQLHMGLYIVQTMILLIGNIALITSGNLDLGIIFYEIDIVLAIVQICLLVMGFIFLRKRSMHFRTCYVIVLSTFILTSMLLLVAGDVTTGIYNIVVCVIWIIYLFKSERVKNTFRKSGQKMTEYEQHLQNKVNEAYDDTKADESTQNTEDII